jgi:hypothetical protein
VQSDSRVHQTPSASFTDTAETQKANEKMKYYNAHVELLGTVV